MGSDFFTPKSAWSISGEISILWPLFPTGIAPPAYAHCATAPRRLPAMDTLRHSSLSVRIALALVLAMVALLPGCVRRRLLIRSNPPGAMVYVDNQPIGTTPCATDFLYYGTREIRLVKAGYETLTVNQPLPAPWYEIPPLDFVSENLYPGKIQDYRTVTLNLSPQVIVPTEQLLSRAEQLRQSTQQGAVLPAGAAVPAAPTGPVFPAPGLPVLPPTTVQPELIAPPPASAQTLPPGGQPLQVQPQ